MSPRQREAYTWFTTEFANRRTAAMATYAYDQIDQSRAALNAILE